MIDDRVLYIELLRAIQKRGGEKLYRDEEEARTGVIKFSAESLMRTLDPETRRYEQSVRSLLAKMVSKGVLAGSSVEYCTKPKFRSEYEDKGIKRF